MRKPAHRAAFRDTNDVVHTYCPLMGSPRPTVVANRRTSKSCILIETAAVCPTASMNMGLAVGLAFMECDATVMRGGFLCRTSCGHSSVCDALARFLCSRLHKLNQFSGTDTCGVRTWSRLAKWFSRETKIAFPTIICLYGGGCCSRYHRCFVRECPRLLKTACCKFPTTSGLFSGEARPLMISFFAGGWQSRRKDHH